MLGKIVSHYKILEKLGEGGMGVVYKAEDKKLKRTVALKFLLPDLISDDEIKQRFMNEAQAAAALDHPNICTIYEIDDAEDQTFISMAYIEGQSLQNKIESGSLKLSETLDIAIQIVQGLREAHSKGIIHRDIKPANIMVTSRKNVKILDFGLAKLLTENKKKLTQTGVQLGTITYMSPEQVHGEKVDHLTDIWSFGVVFYELLTGQLPFYHEYIAAIAFSIVSEPPIPPTEIRGDIPTTLERIVFKCLRKERRDRFQSTEALLADLIKVRKTLESETDEIKLSHKKKPTPKKDTERRQATVVVAEISSYTELLERIDAEVVNVVMNQCFELIGTISQKYGGTVDKIVENCITLLFGVPVAIESAPYKAINAAIEIRNKLAQFNKGKNLPIPLDIRTGINTGVVVAGPVGSEKKKEFTVIGDTVLTASRLKDLSDDREIYVGASTYRYTKNEFEYKPVRPITLKSITNAVSAFELLSTKERISRPQLGLERMIYSDLVGRERELNILELHVLKVINGEGSIVNLIGEAGIGKSRLISELKTREVFKGVVLAEGTASSIGMNLSYHPFIDIFKNWANVKEEDGQREVISKLEESIGSVYPEGVSEILPFIATLMGTKLKGKYAERVRGIEGQAMEKLILKNTMELIIKAAELNPIVLIFEDLHWADITSIELLESLLRLAGKNRILFINVFRPNYKETGERLLETIKDRCSNYHSEIYLEPLNEKYCEVLINNLIKTSNLHTDIKAAIANRTEGNPFFIEEVLRSFIDEGIMKQRNGHFKVTQNIDSVLIPETIQDVLMARIDKLDENTKSLLKIASVIGRNFFYKILAEVGKTIEEIDDRLEYLKGVQLILERKRLDEIEYLFKHALVQEVAYESILLKKRKELHLQVANAIESVFSERLHEFYGMLAFHFTRADEMEKAEAYLIKAGEESLKAAASSEALNYYQEALKLYMKKYQDAADPDKVAMLEKNIAIALFNKGHMDEAAAHSDKVLACWGVRRPQNGIIVILNLIWNLLIIIKTLYVPSKRKKVIPSERDNEIINLAYMRGLALAQVDTKRSFIDTIGILKRLSQLDLSKVEKGAFYYVSSVALFSFTGFSFKLGRKILDYSKEYIEKNDFKSELAYNFWKLVHDFLTGNWSKIPKYDENLIVQAQNIGDFYDASVYTFWSALIEIERSKFSDASLTVKRLYEIAEIYENEQIKSRWYLANSKLLLNARRLHDALREADAGISFLNRIGHNLLVIYALGIKLYAHCSRILKEREIHYCR